jgi:hypothetical protein
MELRRLGAVPHLDLVEVYMVAVRGVLVLLQTRKETPFH